MALWICRRCSCRFAVGLRQCPQCTSESAYEEGQDMPKISALDGPSIAGQEGGEQPSATNSSSTSGAKPQTSPEASKRTRRRPVPMTEPLSRQDRPETSTARSTTTTSGPETDE